VDNKLAREPLFVPTKPVKIKGTSKTGLLRPIITPIIEPSYHIVENNIHLLTDSKLKQLREKLIELSYKGYAFTDGLQLGADKQGRILQFDLGSMRKFMRNGKPTAAAFTVNNNEWRALLRHLKKSFKTYGLVQRTPELDKKYGKAASSSVKKSETHKQKPKNASIQAHLLEDKDLIKLRNKIRVFSSKGYTFKDGYQLEIDKTGRILQFDLGSMKKYKNINLAYNKNNVEWLNLLKKLKKDPKMFGQIKQTSATSKQPKQTIFIDPKFLFHPKHQEIYQKVEKALKNFPEIDTIKLSTFYPKPHPTGIHKYEANDVMAVAGFGGLIEFNILRVPSYNTIYHELYHIVQGKRKSTKKKSTGTFELEATLFGMARLPKKHVETNEMPYLCNVPKSKIVAYGKLALKEKEKGNKNYVKALTDQIDKDFAKDVKTNRAKKWKRIGRSMPDPRHNIKFIKMSDGNNYAKAHTYSKVHNMLRRNIRYSQQIITDKLIKPYNPKSGYGFEKADLIKVPTWMKAKQKPKLKTKSKL
jgi:hypothetical protein